MPRRATSGSNDALIGYTGFVGSNLARQQTFSEQFRSTNIGDLAASRFDSIWCAGSPGTKWMANAQPEQDRQAIAQLCRALGRARCKRLVLISSVDVYRRPQGVVETSETDAVDAYGANRAYLEQFVRRTFETCCIVRLPGLFGPGLKKNAIFDLLHKENLGSLHPDSFFQWYNLKRLSRDIAIAEKADLTSVNLTSEPLALRDIAGPIFGRSLNAQVGQAVRYDVHTEHGCVFGSQGPYLYSRQAIEQDLCQFAANQRSQKLGA